MPLKRARGILPSMLGVGPRASIFVRECRASISKYQRSDIRDQESVASRHFNQPRQCLSEASIDFIIINRTTTQRDEFHHLLANMATSFDHCAKALSTRP